MEIFSKRKNIFFLSLSDINYKFNTLKFQQTIILFYVFKHKLALSHLPKYWDLGSYHNWQEKPLLLITTKYLIWSISILLSSHSYSLLSLVSEALLLPGFGQVALNDIYINYQVAPTQKNANKLFCSLRCTEMLNRLCEEFQHRLCTASLCANLLPSGSALVTAGIQHLFITWGASMLWFPWFACFSFFLCSVGHCSTQNQDFPQWFPLLFLSVPDFSRF